MKGLLFTPLALFLFSCGGNSTAAGSAATPTTGGDSTYEGKGSLVYTIDGRHAAIKDYLVTGGKNWIALVVNNISPNQANGTVKVNLTNYVTKEVFDLVAADKGATSVIHFSPGKNYTKEQATYMSPKYENYYGDSVSITISALDANHAAGTFTGIFLSDDGKKVRITDGSFDIPIPAKKPGQ